MTADIFKEITPDIKLNEPMSRHTSFRIGGAADMFATVRSAAEAAELIRAAHRTRTPFIVLGNGSNILVGDGGVRGLVIQIGITDIEVNGTEIYAGAGAMMSKIAAEAAKNALSGFEPLSGIPGTLGGCIYMNAGAYGGEIKNAVKSVEYLDDNGQLHTVTANECLFGYRSSIFTDGGKYITSAVLHLEKGSEDDIRAEMADYNLRRTSKQPLSLPSAGSVFKRPEGSFAGKLIEDAGLKGCAIGGAQVSELHAGFIVNRGAATAKDVRDLIEHIQNEVKKQFGIQLQPEIKMIGED